MPKKAIFSGLVFDENDNPVNSVYVGDEPCYVVDDMGFMRHIPAEEIDLQVLQNMSELIQGHEDMISEQTAQMLGQDDIFSKALIKTQLENIEGQFDTILESGIPEEARSYMGMMGFKIRIDHHGEVIDIEQPGIADPHGE